LVQIKTERDRDFNNCRIKILWYKGEKRERERDFNNCRIKMLWYKWGERGRERVQQLEIKKKNTHFTKNYGV
jgi:hypothetical protein